MPRFARTSTTAPSLRTSAGPTGVGGLRSRRGAIGGAVVGALVLFLAAPSLAAPKKKRSGKTDAGETAPAGDEATAVKPAAQEQDKERPKTILGSELVAPPKDALGRVHFGSPGAAGTGRVAITGPATAQIQVMLEGRYFGTAPVTIHSIPRGDYVVEGTFPDGKTVTKPVTVVENESATIELAPTPEAAPLPTRGRIFDAQMTPARLRTAKLLGIAGGSVIILGGVFGYLKSGKEDEYGQPGKTQMQLDDLAADGRRFSVLANLSFAVGGAALLGAAFAAYPMFFGRKEGVVEPQGAPQPRTSFLFVPGPGLASGAVAWSF